MFARLSAENAEKAGSNSVISTSNLQIRVKQKIDSLNKLVSEINELFTTYPLSSETRTRISRG